MQRYRTNMWKNCTALARWICGRWPAAWKPARRRAEPRGAPRPPRRLPGHPRKFSSDRCAGARRRRGRVASIRDTAALATRGDWW